MVAGCISNDGENAPSFTFAAQLHVQDLQRGTFLDQTSRRTHVGLRQQVGGLPEQIPPWNAPNQREVWLIC